jgi:hypothetical protein
MPDTRGVGWLCCFQGLIMKSYPSIQGASRAPLGRPCVAFHKYDGSNLRWEWTKKRGFHKFGARSRLFDQSDEQFGEAVGLFFSNYAEAIEKSLVDGFRHLEQATVFTEFFGPSSFAGTHATNEPKELRLFDVQIHRKGFLGHKDFLNHFGDLPFAAEVVYEGNFNRDFIERVRNGEYVPAGAEGVIAKGGSGHQLWMAKVKTTAYIERLKTVFGVGWEAYGE